MTRDETRNGNIPCLSVKGANLPEAWEKALLALWAEGIDVRTVPAEQPYTLTRTPYFMFREVAALWWYYLQPLWA